MGNYIAARMRNSETGAPFNDGAPLYSWPHRVLRLPRSLRAVNYGCCSCAGRNPWGCGGGRSPWLDAAFGASEYDAAGGAGALGDAGLVMV